MPGTIALGRQILFIVRVGGQDDGQAFGHLDARAFQPLDLLGIVGEQPHLFDAQQLEHARRDREITRVDGKAKADIGIDGIEPLILQGISAQLVDEADPAPFLPQIEQHAPAGVGDPV